MHRWDSVDPPALGARLLENGELLRTIPITTGKEGFTTRSGVKVIIEKFDVKRMNSETVGISRDDPEAYDIDDVQFQKLAERFGTLLASPSYTRSRANYNPEAPMVTMISNVMAFMGAKGVHDLRAHSRPTLRRGKRETPSRSP